MRASGTSLPLRRRSFLLSALGGLARQGRLEAAAGAVEQAVAGGVAGAAVLCAWQGKRELGRAFGKAPDANAVFLLASITKPMTAAAIMCLVDEGRMSLDQPVSRWVPELLAGDGPDRAARARLTLHHLLTHTSGLPDMPPGNKELRRRNAPLSEFLSAGLSVPLAFAPGTRVRYQSMGFLLAATAAERAAAMPFRDHLQRALLAPLGLEDVALGLGRHHLDEVMKCEVPDEPGGWNTAYWRNLGAPWGGAHGSAPAVMALLRSFARPGRGPLRPATVRRMLAVQTPAGQSRYGLGWRLGVGGSHSSPVSFGHSGSTGVLCWMDPAADVGLVLLTTRPFEQIESALMRPVSELVAG